jgi:hypothetical protein
MDKDWDEPAHSEKIWTYNGCFYPDLSLNEIEYQQRLTDASERNDGIERSMLRIAGIRLGFEED